MPIGLGGVRRLVGGVHSLRRLRIVVLSRLVLRGLSLPVILELS